MIIWLDVISFCNWYIDNYILINILSKLQLMKKNLKLNKEQDYILVLLQF